MCKAAKTGQYSLAYWLFRSFSTPYYNLFERSRENKIHPHVALKPFVSLIVRPVACGARITVNTNTQYRHTQIKYSTVTLAALAHRGLNYNDRHVNKRNARWNLTRGAHAQRGCLSSPLQFAPRRSVRSTNDTTYSAGNENQFN